jgi:hypothetical protein
MSSHSQPIEQRLIKICEDLQINSDQNLDRVLELLARLQVQAKVQKSLESTAQLLRKSREGGLPNQLATRVKHIIRFVYGESCNDERGARLRKLECNALKFCGLAYKVRDILDLPGPEFDFLIEHIDDFVRSRGLVQYLYRDDIDKAVNNKLDPKDEELFRIFLKCSFITTQMPIQVIDEVSTY